ncbi:Sterol regulatory element-binding protein 1 [Teratosphaeria destructans]|uniref:Sterol regulatory element-binding protein 1 n=1 Tax=Teratosphaeria destructans TaxID=418781 RepID=A0A9W7W7B6_9PEZI|nr:Sterol regulatory element-binding protein 1 [Teratosphaeria destructans]
MAVDSVSPWNDTFPNAQMPSQNQTGAYYQIPAASDASTDQSPSPSLITASPKNPFVKPSDCDLTFSALKTGAGVMCWDDKRCPIPVDKRDPGRCHPQRSTTDTAAAAATARRSIEEEQKTAIQVQPPPTLKRHNTDLDDVETEDSPPEVGGGHSRKPSEVKSRRQIGRVPHNLIERRYRDNLNSQIEALRLTVPALRDAYDCTAPDVEESGLATVAPAKLPSKAVIISTAVDYVKQLENEKLKLQAATKSLQEQVAGLQKLVRCDDCAILQYLASLQLDSNGTTPTMQ